MLRFLFYIIHLLLTLFNKNILFINESFALSLRFIQNVIIYINIFITRL